MEITKDQWYQHPDFRKELEDLFKTNRTLQIAFAIVKEGGLKPIPTPSGIDLIQFFGLMGAKRDGYFEALKNLKDLSKPQAAKMPEPLPWTTPQRSGPDADKTSAP